jgi:hypothetical protein
MGISGFNEVRARAASASSFGYSAWRLAVAAASTPATASAE